MTGTPPLRNGNSETGDVDSADVQKEELMQYFLRLVLEADVNVRLPEDLRKKVTSLIGQTFPFGVDVLRSRRKEVELLGNEFGQQVLAVTDENLFAFVEALFQQEAFIKVFQLPHEDKALDVAKREFKVDPMRMAGLFLREFFSHKFDPALLAGVLLSAGVEAGVAWKYKEFLGDGMGVMLFMIAILTAMVPFMWEEIRAKTLVIECGRRTSPLYGEIRRYNELLCSVTEAPDRENILALLKLRREAEKHMFVDRRDRLAEEVRDIAGSVGARVEVAEHMRNAAGEVDGTDEALKRVRQLAALRQRGPQS